MKKRKIRCVLDTILHERRMNQEQLSIEIGASRESLRKLRTNSSNLLPRKLINDICSYFEIEICELFILEVEE